jgi:AbrB family looped-hinge helix DNA binding protein
MFQKTSRVGKPGNVVIPAALRRRFGIEEGSLVIAEDRGEGILIRPAVAVPLESYSQEKKAEFLLSNAVDDEDYARAGEEVREMGLDPAARAHRKP